MRLCKIPKGGMLNKHSDLLQMRAWGLSMETLSTRITELSWVLHMLQGESRSRAKKIMNWKLNLKLCTASVSDAINWRIQHSLAKKKNNVTKTMCACLEFTTQWNKDVLYFLFARIMREYKNRVLLISLGDTEIWLSSEKQDRASNWKPN